MSGGHARLSKQPYSRVPCFETALIRDFACPVKKFFRKSQIPLALLDSYLYIQVELPF